MASKKGSGLPGGRGASKRRGGVGAPALGRGSGGAPALGRGGGGGPALGRGGGGSMGDGGVLGGQGHGGNGNFFGTPPFSSSEGLWEGVESISPSYMHSWDPSSSPRPPGGFMSYICSQPQNLHFVGTTSHSVPVSTPASTHIDASGSLNNQQAEVVDSDDESVRTEKRILWSVDEDVRLMSAWIENSTDSTCGADRGGNQYWGQVCEAYNKNTPTNRRRNQKQCKDRWHKINKLVDLFESAHAKARNTFTSGYSDVMWLEAAHKFYLEDNNSDDGPKLGPFVLTEVWKICREVPKWKTYNVDLKNARKRKHNPSTGDEDKDESVPEMPRRPIGQRAAKRLAALAAQGTEKGTSSEAENEIDVETLERVNEIQENARAGRIQLLQMQEKVSSQKLEASKLNHLTAQETKEGKRIEVEAKKLEKESKMMEAYNNLIAQDTSTMSNEEKAERMTALKCFRKMLFPDLD